MKTIISAVICLFIGLSAGLFYGWRTGVVDGQTQATLMALSVVKNYGAYRETKDVIKRDKIMDFLTIGCMANFADGRSYSPVYMFFHPKADAGLIDSAIVWQLDHPDSPETKLRPDSLTVIRLAQMKEQNAGYWASELQLQKKKREEIRKIEQGAADQPSPVDSLK